jgi:CBS domain-containing protein
VVTRGDLRELQANLTRRESAGVSLADVVKHETVTAYPDEPLRHVVNRMAATGLTRLPVVQRGPEQELLGVIGLPDLLKARELTLQEEHHRERVLRLHLPPALRRSRAETTG